MKIKFILDIDRCYDCIFWVSTIDYKMNEICYCKAMKEKKYFKSEIEMFSYCPGEKL